MHPLFPTGIPFLPGPGNMQDLHLVQAGGVGYHGSCLLVQQSSVLSELPCMQMSEDTQGQPYIHMRDVSKLICLSGLSRYVDCVGGQMADLLALDLLSGSVPTCEVPTCSPG